MESLSRPTSLELSHIEYSVGDARADVLADGVRRGCRTDVAHLDAHPSREMFGDEGGLLGLSCPLDTPVAGVGTR